MEALRDAVVTRKAPHSYDGLKPLAQCTPELSEQHRGIMQQHGSVASLLNLGEQGSGEAERSQPSKLKAPRAIKPQPDTPARPAAAAAPRISLRAAIETMSAAKAHHAPSSVANRAPASAPC